MNNRDMLIRELMNDRASILTMSKKYSLMARTTQGKVDPRLTQVYMGISEHLRIAGELIHKD